MVIVKSVAGKAAPYWACAACGDVIARKGIYGWRWAAVGSDEIAAVSCWHAKCAPAGGEYELADLEKLPGFLAHNFENWKLARPPRAGGKGLRSHTAQRAAVLLADAEPSEAQVMEPAIRPEPLTPELLPQTPVPRIPSPDPEPKAAASWPCPEVLSKPNEWDRETWKHCGQPTKPGRYFCEMHDLVLQSLMHHGR